MKHSWFMTMALILLGLSLLNFVIICTMLSLSIREYPTLVYHQEEEPSIIQIHDEHDRSGMIAVFNSTRVFVCWVTDDRQSCCEAVDINVTTTTVVWDECK